MLFNSLEFLVFFPVVVAVYLIIPKKLRLYWLLVTSYYFYMSWNPRYALLIALSTGVTYACGLAVGRLRAKGHRKGMKLCVAASLLINLGILAVFKYANFALDTLSAILERVGRGPLEKRLDLLLPVGISFYTFQALSYTIDVYRGEIEPERSLPRYALFVSFFPQLVAGPIERSKNLLPQFQNLEAIRAWDFDRVRDGFCLMMWGLFQKLVIADRAALLVDRVVNGYDRFGFAEIAVAMVLFAFQIYCDFGGYTCIARGAAKVMGFSLMDNFRQPYLAGSIRDFWRRWHISLTTWFTDYLYIPLGGNRKGTLRKYLNILIVFAVSGLWHGASWNFVAWGCLHAVYQIAGDVKNRILARLSPGPRRDSFSRRLRQRIATFALVDFAWIFFVATNFSHARAIVRQMFTVFKTTGVADAGLKPSDWPVLLASIALLVAVDILHERGRSLSAAVSRQEPWLRWLLPVGLIWAIIMFGIYGASYDASAFIYFQF